MTRASISSALNYGEAILAESRRDFLHKLKLVLKELKEVNVALNITLSAELLRKEQLSPIMKESDELVSIFVKSTETISKSLGRYTPPKSRNPKS